MARPVDVSQLLGNLNKKKNDGKVGKVLQKPKFLTREERDALLTEEKVTTTVATRKNGREIKSVVTDNAHAQIEENENDIRTHNNKSRKSKFNFEWHNSEDTLLDYKPLTSLRVNDLLKSKKSIDSLNKLEETYIGRHWTEKSLNEMTDRDWRIFKEDFQISTKGNSIAQPLRNWTELNLIPKDLLEIITKKLNFENPTSIQRVTIPNAVNNRSLIGIASTGSGKTLAFIIPILSSFSKTLDRPRSIKVLEGPKALILAPTRELAQQIKNETEKLTKLWKNHDCKVISIVGGHSIEEITSELSDGCDILVATPGRLIDCLENHILTLGEVSTLVLDEADKMIDLGFEEQLTTILSKLEVENSISKDKRQTMMFTATMTLPIEKIAYSYLKKPAYLTIGNSTDAIPKIQQIVLYGPDEDRKFTSMINILKDFEPPMIIFINHKRIADVLAERLHKLTRYRVTTLHGSKNQDQREHSLQLLKSGKAQIMIATNVAARGLDIPNVSLVINYEMTKKFEDYVHRIGRTGRAGNIGTALTFIGDYEDNSLLIKLQKFVESNNPLHSNKFDYYIKKLYKTEDNKRDDIIF